MGIASYLVAVEKAEEKQKKAALTVYGIQLAFNFAWTLIFFNAGAYLFAFVWLIILWLLIIATIYLFSKIRFAAGLLLVPYALWVAFAGYLNYSIYLLNRWSLFPKTKNISARLLFRGRCFTVYEQEEHSKIFVSAVEPFIEEARDASVRNPYGFRTVSPVECRPNVNAVIAAPVSFHEKNAKLGFRRAARSFLPLKNFFIFLSFRL